MQHQLHGAILNHAGLSHWGHCLELARTVLLTFDVAVQIERVILMIVSFLDSVHALMEILTCTVGLKK